MNLYPIKNTNHETGIQMWHRKRVIPVHQGVRGVMYMKWPGWSARKKISNDVQPGTSVVAMEGQMFVFLFFQGTNKTVI